MNRSLILSACGICSALLATGCSPFSDMGPKQLLGMTAAGAGSAYVCKSTIGRSWGSVGAAAGCAVAGGLVGSAIGASLDRADQGYELGRQQQAMIRGVQRRQAALSERQDYQQGLLDGSIHTNFLVPGNLYPGGQAFGAGYCREGSFDVSIGGVTQRTWGTACMRADGSWELVHGR